MSCFIVVISQANNISLKYDGFVTAGRLPTQIGCFTTGFGPAVEENLVEIAVVINPHHAPRGTGCGILSITRLPRTPRAERHSRGAHRGKQYPANGYRDPQQSMQQRVASYRRRAADAHAASVRRFDEQRPRV